LITRSPANFKIGAEFAAFGSVFGRVNLTTNYKSASFRNFLKARYAFALSVGVLLSVYIKGTDKSKQIKTAKIRNKETGVGR